MTRNGTNLWRIFAEKTSKERCAANWRRKKETEFLALETSCAKELQALEARLKKAERAAVGAAVAEEQKRLQGMVNDRESAVRKEFEIQLLDQKKELMNLHQDSVFLLQESHRKTVQDLKASRAEAVSDLEFDHTQAIQRVRLEGERA